MTWRIAHSDAFEKSLRRLDRPVQRRILAKLLAIAELEDPTAMCKALAGPMAGLWRLRVGDWRVICDIRRGELIVVALDVGHRSAVY